MHLDAKEPASYPGTGTTWTDLTGNANNATLVNGPTYDNLAIGFDGNNDSATVSPISSQFTTDMTAEVWVKIISYPPSFARFIGTGVTSGNRQFGLWTDSNGRCLWQRWGSVNFNLYPLSPILELNRWHHVCATTSGSEHILYKNGVEIGYATYSPPWADAGENISIAYAGYDNYLNGHISVARLYNRGLLAGEIQQNFNALKWRYGL